LSAVLSVVRGENKPWNLIPNDHDVTIAGDFIAALQVGQRTGNVSSETEQHLKHEFRKLGGRDASKNMLTAAVEAEIERLERQAATLRQLRGALLGVVDGSPADGSPA
jgi:hypothetical protein